MTARGGIPYSDFRFQDSDWLLFGCESDGLPPAVVAEADARLTIPMRPAAAAGEAAVRSLNLSVAAGVVLFEALRQLRSLAPEAISPD